MIRSNRHIYFCQLFIVFLIQDLINLNKPKYFPIDQLIIPYVPNYQSFWLFVGVPTRGPGSQLVNAACFLVPDDDARRNHSNARFILVPAAGPYVQQRGCARALYYLAPGVLVVGGTSKAREGEKHPSLS